MHRNVRAGQNTTRTHPCMAEFADPVILYLLPFQPSTRTNLPNPWREIAQIHPSMSTAPSLVLTPLVSVWRLFPTPPGLPHPPVPTPTCQPQSKDTPPSASLPTALCCLRACHYSPFSPRLSPKSHLVVRDGPSHYFRGFSLLESTLLQRTMP